MRNPGPRDPFGMKPLSFQTVSALYRALKRLLGATNPGNADTHEKNCMCVICEARKAIAKGKTGQVEWLLEYERR
ncbi:MAG: hypothetical protein WC356_04870 [Candidatus Micrarchaeia archaeon]|jgi:hypothetical protein